MITSTHGVLIATLKHRFLDNMQRHGGMSWDAVEVRLVANPEKLFVLSEMESTGGEPDAVIFGGGTAAGSDAIRFVDCAPESPSGRRSLCFDREALDARKANKPGGAAVERAREIGIELLTELQYRALQEIGTFDQKTSSWIATPDAIRMLGGALFCDRRYGQVFTYHNGAESYYAARGFRGQLVV